MSGSSNLTSEIHPKRGIGAAGTSSSRSFSKTETRKGSDHDRVEYDHEKQQRTQKAEQGFHSPRASVNYCIFCSVIPAWSCSTEGHDRVNHPKLSNTQTVTRELHMKEKATHCSTNLHIFRSMRFRTTASCRLAASCALQRRDTYGKFLRLLYCTRNPSTRTLIMKRHRAPCAGAVNSISTTSRLRTSVGTWTL